MTYQIHTSPLERLSEARNGFATRSGLAGGAGRGGAAAGPVRKSNDAGLSATIAAGCQRGAGLAGSSRCRDRSVSSKGAWRTSLRALFFASPLFVVLGCTVNAPISAPINAGVPATPDQVKSCRDSCAKQNSSACFDAAGFSACEAACDAASATGATNFVQCVAAAVCNAKCDDDLKGSPAASDGGTSSGGLGQDGGPLADSGSSGDAAPPPADGGVDASGPDLQACIAACASPLAKSCYEVATMQQQCESACATATSAARSTFVSCTLTQTSCATFYGTTCYGAISN
jgi:hypothetical protein